MWDWLYKIQFCNFMNNCIIMEFYLFYLLWMSCSVTIWNKLFTENEILIFIIIQWIVYTNMPICILLKVCSKILCSGILLPYREKLLSIHVSHIFIWWEIWYRYYIQLQCAVVTFISNNTIFRRWMLWCILVFVAHWRCLKMW